MKNKSKTVKTTCVKCHKPFSYDPNDGEHLLCGECEKAAEDERFRDEHTFTCKTCGKKFTMEQGEVQFFLSNGLSLPKNCPDCRAANKLAAQIKKRQICKDCGREFIITVGESQWYRQMELELPVRCPECRSKRKK